MQTCLSSTAAMLLVFSGAAAPVQGSEQTERWGVFELSLSGPKDGNPFLDVRLTASFRQGKRTVEVAGFYDGEGIYRVRFMPDTEGISWYEHPSGGGNVRVPWRRHFVVDANFTKAFARDLDQDGDVDFIGTGEGYQKADFGWYQQMDGGYALHEFDITDNKNDVTGGHNCNLVDVDGDGDEDLIVGGVDKHDGKQRFRWYECAKEVGEVRWKEHVFGVTSSEGFRPAHGYYCGEMAWADMDGDGDRDFVYAGHGGGFLGWFENRGSSE